MSKYTICEFIYVDGKLVVTNPPKKSGRYHVLKCNKYDGKTKVYADYAYYDVETKAWYAVYPGKEQLNTIIAWQQEEQIAFDLSSINFDGEQPYIAKKPQYHNFVKGHSRMTITKELSAKYKAKHYKKTDCVLATMEYQNENLHEMLIMAIAEIEKSKVFSFYLEKKDMTTKKVVSRKDFDDALSNLEEAIVKYSKE